MRRLHFIILVIFATTISFSKEAKKTDVRSVQVVIDQSLREHEEVAYSPTSLEWKDFSGEPDTVSQWGALTFSGIRLRYKYVTKNDSTKAVVQILPYMSKDKSWYKPYAMNGYTLEHEQRHFDITAIVANELADEIRRTNFNTVDFPTAITLLHKKYIKKLSKMQREYDTMTQHGDNYEEQQNWNNKLSNLLQESDELIVTNAR
jgi:hypothetical protein